MLNGASSTLLLFFLLHCRRVSPGVEAGVRRKAPPQKPRRASRHLLQGVRCRSGHHIPSWGPRLKSCLCFLPGFLLLRTLGHSLGSLPPWWEIRMECWALASAWPSPSYFPSIWGVNQQMDLSLSLSL